MLTKGSPAPDFSLPDRNENHHSLSSYTGKWVVLYFYPRDNTPGCTLEAQDFTQKLSAFEALDAVVLGISADSPSSHGKFCDKKDLAITLLSDGEHEVLEAYHAWREKKMYGKTFMGIVRSTFLINPERKVVEIWDKVKVKGHVDAVIASLEAAKQS